MSAVWLTRILHFLLPILNESLIMPETTVNCDPAALSRASACYCSPEDVQRAEMVYLLLQIAGLNLMPSELAKASACYCAPEDVWRGEVTYLLCQIVNQ